MASVFRYDPFIVHPDFEVNLTSFEFIPAQSRRGKTQTVLKRMSIEGEIKATATSNPTLTQRIEGIRDAYDQDYGDAGLWINGVQTPHALINNHPDNLSGTRVVYRSWHKGDPAEYAVKRMFRVTFAALFRPFSVDQIIAFRETLSYLGTAGPVERFSRVVNGQWPKRQLTSNSLQYIRQTGEIWGLEGYPAAAVIPGPVLPSTPTTLERVDLRDVDQIGGVQVGNAFLEYGYRYTYRFESAVSQTGLVPNQF